MELILDGYRYRNPVSATMTRFLSELAERGDLISDDQDTPTYTIIPPGLTTAHGSLVSGPSGSGKTSAIRSVLGIILQVISHAGYENFRSFQQDQIVWISFDAPSTPSPKALCLNFMKAVDIALGVDRYFPEFSKRSDHISVDLHIMKVQEIAANHYIGLVHLDEMQFFLNYSNNKNAPNLQILEAMFNKLGIPVVISTTNDGLPLINANPQTKRRVISEQHFYLTPLKYGTKPFNEFVDAVFIPKVWGEENVLKNQQEFIRKFHYLTAGLQAVMIRLARLHLQYCVQLDKQPFDIEQLEKVFNSQFKYMKDSLEFLRSGDNSSFEAKKETNENGRTVWCNEEASEQDIPEQTTDDTDSSTCKAVEPTKKSPKKPAIVFHKPSLIGGL
ncbi:MAG: AAA family ATPase [Gammaproteobacteria bacterium]|nr:AAA family ATPase [Gammaproteobacteria bacterium]